MSRWIIAGMVVAAMILSATVVYASHSWGNYHWARTGNPFTLKLVDSMTPAWDLYLGPVSTDWTASSVLDTTIELGADDQGTRKTCKAVRGKERVCNAAYGFNGWLGMATIWISGSHIVQATAKVNDSYFNTSTYNDPNAKRHVLCQEVGHTFGLGHQSFAGSNSCMDDRNGLFDPAYVSPNDHDYGQLATIYGGHTDSSSTVAQGAGLPAPKAGNHDTEDLGEPVPGHEDAHGRPTLFKKVLPDGTIKYTWVFWAEPGNPDKGKS